MSPLLKFSAPMLGTFSRLALFKSKMRNLKSSAIYYSKKGYDIAKENPIIVAGVCAALIFVMTIMVIFTNIFRHFLTTPGTIVMYCTLFFLLVRLVIRSLVFPGSTILWRKKLESNYRSELSRQYATHLLHLGQVIVDLLDTTRHHHQMEERKMVYTTTNSEQKHCTLDSASQGLTLLENMTRNFAIRCFPEAGVTFTKEEKQIQQQFQKSFKSMKQLKVSRSDGSSESFSNFIHESGNLRLGKNYRNYLRENKFRIRNQSAEDARNVGEATRNIQELCTNLLLLSNPVEGKIDSVKRFFAQQPIGSLDQLRTELAYRRNGRQVWIPSGSDGKVKLDGMIFFHPSILKNSSTYYGATTLDSSSPIKKTVVDSSPILLKGKGIPIGGVTSSVHHGGGDGGRSDADGNFPNLINPYSTSDYELKELFSKVSCCVLFCNPNAGFYESGFFQSDWLDFYQEELGCSVLVFNYQSFGRSESIGSWRNPMNWLTPKSYIFGGVNPNTIKQDGISSYKWLERMGCQRIAVHGRSIGSVAACEIAGGNNQIVAPPTIIDSSSSTCCGNGGGRGIDRRKLEFCIVDRGLASLQRTAGLGYGNWAQQALRANLYDVLNVESYVNIKCRKICICDPRDEIIHDMSSLRTGVAYYLCMNNPQQYYRTEGGEEGPINTGGPIQAIPQIEAQNFIDTFQWLIKFVEIIYCDELDELDDAWSDHQGFGGGAAAGFTGLSNLREFIPKTQYELREYRKNSTKAKYEQMLSDLGDSATACGPSSTPSSAKSIHDEKFLQFCHLSSGSGQSSSVNSSVKWLEENKRFVRYLFIDSSLPQCVRVSLDLLLNEFNVGGSGFEDCIASGPNCLLGLNQFLSNLIVWGSIPYNGLRIPTERTEKENLVENLLYRKSGHVFIAKSKKPTGDNNTEDRLGDNISSSSPTTKKPDDPKNTITLEDIRSYHRQLGAQYVVQIRKRFREGMIKVNNLSYEEMGISNLSIDTKMKPELIGNNMTTMSSTSSTTAGGSYHGGNTESPIMMSTINNISNTTNMSNVVEFNDINSISSLHATNNSNGMNNEMSQFDEESNASSTCTGSGLVDGKEEMDPYSKSDMLKSVILNKLQIIDVFLNNLARFLNNNHMNYDYVDEKCGHLVHVDCGHNGSLSNWELYNLRLYLQDLDLHKLPPDLHKQSVVSPVSGDEGRVVSV